MEETRATLRHIPLFAALPDATLARLAAAAVRRTYRPGEIVIIERDPFRAIYIIAAGQVRVFRTSPAGREQVLAHLGPGRSFNTVPLFLPHSVNHATVQAITPTVLYAISRTDMLRQVNECPALALALLNSLASRLDHLVSLVEDLSLRTVRGRLARFLLEQAEAGTVTRRWTQEEIASQLGTVRDMVGRTLRAFAAAGMVRLDRQRIVILDQAQLEAESER